MIKNFLGLICGLLMAAPVCAATKDGQFALQGVGAMRCDALVKAYKDDASRRVGGEVVSWVSGYIDATNRITSGRYDVMPLSNHSGFASVALRICESNGNALFETVASSLIKTFEPLSLTQVSQARDWKNGERRISVSRDVVVKVQQHLVRLGTLDGKMADGSINAKTISALTAFQKSKSIEQTGVPDALTLFVMAQDMRIK